MKCTWKKFSCLILALAMALSCAGAFAEGSVSDAAAAPAATDTGIWEIKAYKDEFDMPTDRNFIVSSVITGSFSNSATTDSDLFAIVAFKKFADVDETYIQIALCEYGKYIVKNASSKARYYNAIVMDCDGNKTYFDSDRGTGPIMPGDDQELYFADDKESQQIIDILKKGGTVRFAIIERDDSNTKYLFSFDATGFDVIYEQWKKDHPGIKD
ncbi:MAG: hypothetical protein RSE58_13900 [Clostridia bacterium]